MSTPQIIVLGMHRSGTSALMGALDEMGVYIGSADHLTGKSWENPKGFFERRDARNICDDLLFSAEADWWNLANFSLDNIPEQVLAESISKIEKMICDLDSHDVWALKEPRLCLLLPIFGRVLKKPVVIHIVRHPLEVASSLKRRNGIPLQAGMALWEKYNAEAVNNSYNLPRIIVNYHEVVVNPLPALKRVGEWLREQGAVKLDVEAAAAAIDPSLHREKEIVPELELLMSDTQKDLWQKLIHEKPPVPINGISSQAKIVLKEFEPEYIDRLNLKKEIQKLSDMCRLYKKNIARQERRLEKLSGKLIEAKSAHKDANNFYASQKRELEWRLKGMYKEVEKLKNSTSWKVTAPLRWAFGRSCFSYRGFRKGVTLIRLISIGQFGKIKKALKRSLLEALPRRLVMPLKSAKKKLVGKGVLEQPKKKIKAGRQREAPARSVGKSIDIVVPVYNALADVQRCLESLRESTDGLDVRVYIVNDGSDKKTTDWLRSFHQNNRQLFRLIENGKNLGYTCAVNTGIRATTGDYVVMLNSDTIAPKGWLQSLSACMNSDPNMGIIGPLSNAASWQSIPELTSPEGGFAVNKLPPGWTVDDMAEFVRSRSNMIYPRVPFVNGFCMMVSRKVIGRVGLFDEKSFPKGYGEENDYCIRAMAEGFQLAIADDAYVFHAKSKSFGQERRKVLAKQGAKKLAELHGEKRFRKLADSVRENRSLAAIRNKFKQQLTGDAFHAGKIDGDKLRVLFLLPVTGHGGGIHSIVQDVMGLRRMGVEARIAIRGVHSGFYFSAYQEINGKHDLFLPYDGDEDLSNEARGFDLVVATIFTSVKLADLLCRSNSHLKAGYYIQDYEPWFYEKGTELWEEAKGSYSLLDGAVLFAKTDWIRNKVMEEHDVYVHKVSPSIDHEIYKPLARRGGSKKEKPFVLSAMIRPKTPRRGAERTMKLLKRIKNKYGKNVKVEVFGCRDSEVEDSNLLRDFEYTNHGVLKRPEVAAILQQSDCFVDLSDYQAFGRTALEAMACGSTAMVPVNGGVHEYAKDSENALIVDPGDEESCFVKLLEIIEDRDRVERLKANALLTASEFTIHKAAVSEFLVLSSHVMSRRILRS